jgi:hypothetical protein
VYTIGVDDAYLGGELLIQTRVLSAATTAERLRFAAPNAGQLDEQLVDELRCSRQVSVAGMALRDLELGHVLGSDKALVLPLFAPENHPCISAVVPGSAWGLGTVTYC